MGRGQSQRSFDAGERAKRIKPRVEPLPRVDTDGPTDEEKREANGVS